MDPLCFPKDAFLMSFLLRSSFALDLETPDYTETVEERRNSSVQSSASASSSSQSSPQETGGFQHWESRVSELPHKCHCFDNSLQDKINTLPKILITQEHVDNMEVCSICMENFIIDEEAKKLPCAHLFHVPCVSPWLKMRQTCPICRKVAVVARKRTRSRSRFQPFRPRISSYAEQFLNSLGPF